MAKILIVDDDPDLVQLLTMALSSKGHTVESAGDPAEGMTVCRSFKPELIMLDYHMPGDTGAHLFENLRRNKATAKTPILFMSGEAHPDEVLAEVADPSNARFLSKPVQIEDLRRIIEDMLAKASP
jgi:CheY-like chemotaxis protein